MAAVATSSSRTQGPNPTTLKFTAVKVDVSALSASCRCKAFVVSSQTTSRDLADMVLRKLKIDTKDHVNGTCLIGEQCESGEKRVLSDDEKVLGLLGNKHKRALTLQLVPVDTVKSRDGVPTQPNQDDLDLRIKAGNLSDSAKNGLTLPGYVKTDMNYNLAVGSGFVTSTPNPDVCESVSSNVDSGFMIHYEPLGDLEGPGSARGRSRSFDLARENGYKLDTSNDNASDSGMVLNGNNPNPEPISRSSSHSSDSPEQHYSARPSPKDGFQILQSQNSAWTPFSRHVSDGFLRTTSYQALPTFTKSSAPVDSGSGSGLVRRRSLPKLSLSQEQINEKQKSVTDLFTAKLKVYLQKARTKNKPETVEPKPKHDIVRQESGTRDDDTMSVTSAEVAEIMSSASPMKPYEEDEENTESEYSTPETASTYESSVLTDNSPYVFQPLPGPHSPTASNRNVTDETGNEHKRNGYPAEKPSLGEFVEQSMHSFMVSTTPVNDASSRKTSGDPHKQKNSKYSAMTSSTNRGVPLFTMLTTHTLAPVMVRRNREIAPNKLIGLRLCDVTYAKCVRHVVRHWATNDTRHFSVDPNLSDRLLVAIGGMDRRTTVILAGKVFRGDIVVEVNGTPTLELPARDVISKILRAEVVSLVVARSRLNVERAQSP